MNENLSTQNDEPKTSDRFWFLSCFLITAIATFLRFFWLGLKPLHHDEGVNGFFLTTLFRTGEYKYDPANYHGPTLYYIALAFAKVFGLSTIPVRASVAIFGVLTVILIFWLRKYIGRIGAMFAALFVALSPGMSFISRYFIHETFFVFLGLAFVVSVIFFIENRKPGVIAIGWMALIILVCLSPTTLNLSALIGKDNQTAVWSLRIIFFIIEAALTFYVIRLLLAWYEGRAIYLILASACVSLMFATKETAFITLGTMAAACVCVWLWRRIFHGFFLGELLPDELSAKELTWANFKTALGNRADLILISVAAAVVFIYVGVLFFSSFFTFPEGVWRAFEAYTSGQKPEVMNTRKTEHGHISSGGWRSRLRYLFSPLSGR
jgi:Predicted membrane-bound mannosyltransferase